MVNSIENKLLQDRQLFQTLNKEVKKTLFYSNYYSHKAGFSFSQELRDYVVSRIKAIVEYETEILSGKGLPANNYVSFDLIKEYEATTNIRNVVEGKEERLIQDRHRKRCVGECILLMMQQ